MVAKCPTCGNRLWQVILDDPSRRIDQCPKCGRTITKEIGSQSEASRFKNQQDLSNHFENMTPQPLETEVDSWPEEYSEYFPSPEQPISEDEEPEWISDLEGDNGSTLNEEQSSQDELDFSDREREEAHRRMLRSHGYGMDVDSQGLRLTGAASGRVKGSAELSPYDIVRLASELEGRMTPVEERVQCPACEAVVLPTDKICQWCSAPLA